MNSEDVFEGEHLTGRIPQLQGAEGHKENQQVEDKTDTQNEPAGRKTDLSAIDKHFDTRRGRRVNIYLQRPAQGQKHEYPHIIRAQAPADHDER